MSEDEYDIYLHAAYIKKIEDEYQVFCENAKSLIKKLTAKVGMESVYEQQIQTLGRKIYLYSNNKDRIRNTLINCKIMTSLEELDQLLYDTLETVNAHTSIGTLDAYRKKAYTDYYSDLISQSKINMSEYVDEINSNVGSYAQGLQWYGENSNSEELFNDSAYFYKMYKHNGKCYVMRMLRTELTDDADYPEETLIASNPGDRTLVLSPGVLNDLNISSSELDTAFEKIDGADTKITVLETDTINPAETELNQLKVKHEQLCEQLDEQLSNLNVEYEKEISEARRNLNTEMSADIISKDSDEAYQRACDIQNDRIEKANENISQLEAEHHKDESAIQYERMVSEVNLNNKQSEYDSLLRTKADLEEKRISALEDYLNISRDSISNFDYHTYCNFLVASIVEDHSKKYLGNGLLFNENLRMDYKRDENGNIMLDERGQKIGVQRSANDIFTYLSTPSMNENRWKSITPELANEIVNTLGIPVVAAIKRPVHGHVAIVYPGYIPEGKFNEKEMMVYAAGGRHPVGDSNIGTSFNYTSGSDIPSGISYFALQIDYQNYFEAIKSRNLTKVLK